MKYKPPKYILFYVYIFFLLYTFLFIRPQQSERVQLGVYELEKYNETKVNLNIFNIFGLIVIAVGFFWECVADIQLNQFKRNNTSKKTFLQSGLWSLSRHPNYFGEIMFWWGIYTFSIVNSLALISIVGPIVFSYLIINVTGVKTMDKRMSQNYDGYSEYINSSNSLIPKIFS